MHQLRNTGQDYLHFPVMLWVNCWIAMFPCKICSICNQTLLSKCPHTETRDEYVHHFIISGAHLWLLATLGFPHQLVSIVYNHSWAFHQWTLIVALTSQSHCDLSFSTTYRTVYITTMTEWYTHYWAISLCMTSFSQPLGSSPWYLCFDIQHALSSSQLVHLCSIWFGHSLADYGAVRQNWNMI